MLNAIILDIEGTTTPVAFVTETLFPYVLAYAPAYLSRPDADREAITRLWEEYGAEATPRVVWDGPEDRRGLTAFVEALTRADVKSVGLKHLQGILWEAGYRDGTLKGEVYPDVPPALERWRSEGRIIAVYSSGSVPAQKLLFAHTAYGDLTPYFSAHFDATIGGKKEAESYRKIAAALSVPPADCLFLTDALAEADAARAAGMFTLFSLRPGNPGTDPGTHILITSFDQVGYWVIG